ncbi:M15 family metallopeptidase [Dactylosporangium sp. CS-033363]|uniref:M15 family metallopeptidase n=1 Tax=Dactylosporangium sp. CS-033363 TaxID=3239935 RepID=UPI003D8C8438
MPADVRLHVVEGYRPAYRQQAIIDRYAAELRAVRPGIGEPELHTLTSRFVAPLAVAPHVAGAAVDLTLTDGAGAELDLGTAIDATPEESDGRCYFAAEHISGEARANRQLLARVLGREGLVNYHTEWWHWSYGDRYWALTTGSGAALYGPVATEAAAAALHGPVATEAAAAALHGPVATEAAAAALHGPVAIEGAGAALYGPVGR